MNISGVIVKAYPEKLFSIERMLTTMEGVEVHGNDEEGRMLLTVSQKTANSLVNTLDEIQHVPGVVATAMIYNECED